MTRFDAVIFDWAGTVIDFGSFAPMGAFVEAFRRFGVEVSIEEARAPMGARKRDHVRAMLDQPRIAAEWARVRGHAPTGADVDAVYDVFVPMNETVAPDHAALVPGAREAVERLRGMGLKIGSTTGYVPRSWSGSCRSPPRRATRRTVSSAPTTCPRAAPAR